MSFRHFLLIGCWPLLAAQAAQWAPIRHRHGGQDQLHDRASYRFFWQVLQRAFDTGRVLPAEVREFFR